MIKSNTVYWTQSNGVKVDIDTMDIQHLRNTLKMIVRIVDNYDSAVKTKKIPSSKCNITKRFEDEAINLMGPDDEFPIFKFN
jgi:hypothetical protein